MLMGKVPDLPFILISSQGGRGGPRFTLEGTELRGDGASTQGATAGAGWVWSQNTVLYASQLPPSQVGEVEGHIARPRDREGNCP